MVGPFPPTTPPWGEGGGQHYPQFRLVEKFHQDPKPSWPLSLWRQGFKNESDWRKQDNSKTKIYKLKRWKTSSIQKTQSQLSRLDGNGLQTPQQSIAYMWKIYSQGFFLHHFSVRMGIYGMTSQDRPLKIDFNCPFVVRSCVGCWLAIPGPSSSHNYTLFLQDRLPHRIPWVTSESCQDKCSKSWLFKDDLPAHQIVPWQGGGGCPNIHQVLPVYVPLPTVVPLLILGEPSYG